ncbi:MAG: virulence factor MviN [Micrococcales bacterium]|nr:virulence factor MviN [Micrococcales bacterium]
MSQADHTDPTTVQGRGMRQGLLGAAAMIAVLTVVSRVLGMVRQMTQAGTVGAGNIGDAYNRANTMSNLLFEIVVGGTLAVALIPLIAGPISRRDRDQTRQIIAGTMGWVLVLLVPLGLVLAAASGPIAIALNLNAKAGVDLGTLRQTTQFFLLVFAVQVPLYGFTVLANAVLQAHRRFFWPAFTPLLSSLVVIGTYLWYGRLAHHEISDPEALATGALEVLAWGTTAGVVAMCVPALVAVARIGYLPAPRLSFPPGLGARLRSLMVAGIAGVAVGEALTLVVMLATSAGDQEGSYTVWVWTQQVYILPVAVFAIPLLTSAFPRLSAWAQEEARDRFAALSALTARAVVVATGTGAAVLAAAAPAVAVVFGVLASRQGVDKVDVVGMMTIALTWTVVGLPGHALMYQGQRTLFALQHAKAALVVGSVGWALAGVLMVVGLVTRLPVQLITMLSAAYALGVAVGGVVAAVVVARVAGRPAVAGLVRTSGAVVLGAVAAAVAGRWVADTVVMLLGKGIWQGVAAGGGAALVGLVMMVAVLYVGDRTGVRDLVQLVRDRRGRRTPGSRRAQ